MNSTNNNQEIKDHTIIHLNEEEKIKIPNNDDDLIKLSPDKIKELLNYFNKEAIKVTNQNNIPEVNTINPTINSEKIIVKKKRKIVKKSIINQY